MEHGGYLLSDAPVNILNPMSENEQESRYRHQVAKSVQFMMNNEEQLEGLRFLREISRA